MASLSLVVVTAFVATGTAQRRGGPPTPSRAAGSIERITVHGKALEGNLEGDSPDRPVTVYLPPSYARDQSRRFPVVYLLHGYGGNENTFISQLADLQASADARAAEQGFSELIVVTPSADTLHKGSMYTSSPTTGDWERFIADDLVAYIDSHYRTLANRTSRGVGGHSMGGYGALRLALKRPDVFMGLYVMSACCLTAPEFRPEDLATAAGVTTRAQAEALARAPGFGPSVVFAFAAAWSPNPGKAPLFLDLPSSNGKVLPDVMAKWVASSGLEVAKRDATALHRYYAVAIDIGAQDTLIASNRLLHEDLTRRRIPHYYEEYEGDHTNRIRERLGRNVLPFFAKNLVSPANPTSPTSPPK